ncbi:hypothetical protein BgiBS90_010654 [Biomphalaria glabrata]|nr:hypothetical protein BgiBS90_010654 [Biomphalaria glabrata]
MTERGVTERHVTEIGVTERLVIERGVTERRLTKRVLRLCTGHLAKAVFLMLVIGMLLYCFQEQMVVSVLAINGIFQQNSTKSEFVLHDDRLYDDVLPTFFENHSEINFQILHSNVSVNISKFDELSTVRLDNETITSFQIVKTTATPTDESVSSTACVFPHINPFDPEIMKMAGLDRKTVQCKSNMADLSYYDGSSLVVNTTLVSEKHGHVKAQCKYQNIWRQDNDDKALHFSNFSAAFTDSLKLPPDAEFILVVCEGDLNAEPNNDTSSDATTTATPPERLSILSRTYYSLVPRHEKLEKVEALLLNKRKAEANPKETMNVLMVGFDGVPRHQFLRAMNKTYGLLMKDFNSFDMSMYTQVGLNTFPNFMALLNGQLEEEVNAWWDYKKYTDGFDLVWKDFQRAGYRTLFTEDCPSIGAFHYEKIGFLNPPTIHCSRALSVAIERDKEICNAGQHCVGNQPEISFHFDYIKRFFETFPEKPLYAMSFFTKATHDDMTNLKMADDLVYDFYNQMNTSGFLNNTLLITFSDHGQRWGSIRSTFNGVIESRTPYAIFTLPSWFLEKYPDAAKNLKINSGRLTTHFDTHATLQDLLYFHSSGDIPLRKPKHGISLFKEVSKNRTCSDIPIPADFCVCGQQAMNSVDVDSDASKLLAKKVMESINDKRDSDLCHELKLDKILEIIFMKFPDNILKEKLDKSLFKVRIQTKPGLAIYEATVNAVVNDLSMMGSIMNWLGLSQNKLSNIDVGHSIDRLNLYKGQADCVRDARQKPFCFCKDIHTT